jgi:hypothetical protein
MSEIDKSGSMSTCGKPSMVAGNEAMPERMHDMPPKKNL